MTFAARGGDAVRRVAVGLLVLAVPAPARAAADCQVTLTITSDPGQAPLAARVREHLQALLRERGREACESTSRDVPAVVVQIAEDDAGSVTATSRVTRPDPDASAPEERVLDVTRAPREVRPLAIARAVDELLRAGNEDPAPPRAPPPPPAPLPPPLPEEPLGRWSLGASGHGTFAGERIAVGGSVVGAARLVPRLRLVGRAGGEAGTPRRGLHGEARMDGLVLGLGLSARVTPEEARFGLDAVLEAQVARVFVTASAAPGGVARDDASLAGVGRVGLVGSVAVSRARIFVGAHAAWAALPVRARDEGATVTAMSGVGAVVELGALFTLDGRP